MQTLLKISLVKHTKTSCVEIVAMLFLSKSHSNNFSIIVPIHQPANSAYQSTFFIFYKININTNTLPFSGLCINKTVYHFVICA